VLSALTDPVLMFVPDTVALLQLLTWENPHALGHVPGRLASVVTSLTGAQLVHVLPAIIGPVRDVLAVRDTHSLLRAYYALFSLGATTGHTGIGLMHAILDGSSQGWGALRKMMMLACVEGATRPLLMHQVHHLFSLSATPQSGCTIAALAAELGTIEAELAAMEAPEPQQATANLIRQHRGGLLHFKYLCLAMQQRLQQAAALLAAQQAGAAVPPPGPADVVLAAAEARPAGRGGPQVGAADEGDDEEVVEVHLDEEEGEREAQ
jgi:hypothetical protein